jgi:hypothetical protein
VNAPGHDFGPGLAQVDQVAGDFPEAELGQVTPSIYVTASFIGGDPLVTRPREITVTIPCHDAVPADYTAIIRATLAGLAQVAKLARWETTLNVGPESIRVDGASS